MGRLTVIRASDRTAMDTTQTPGMRREQAIAGQGVWVGLTHTAPGVTSGWHHHGDYDTYIYMAAGVAHGDFGSGGGEHVEARAGDFIHVPKHTIHRESNPGGEESAMVIVRVGSGPPVINVEGPER